jgi:hypothetical protein
LFSITKSRVENNYFIFGMALMRHLNPSSARS